MRLFEERFWEQKYLDLWSIAHVLSGAIVGYFTWYLGVPLYQSLIIVLIIAALWEIFEIAEDVRESAANRITDIAVAVCGTYTSYYLLEHILETSDTMWYGWAIVVAGFVWGAIGFRAMASYSSPARAFYNRICAWVRGEQ